MDQKTNFIPWNRNWVVIRRHTPIVVRPFIGAIIASLFWRYAIYQYDLSFIKEAENPILFIILLISGFAYAIFAGYAVNAVLTDYREISKAVVQNDIDAFLLKRDEQLPILMHLLIGNISFFVITAAMLYHYAAVRIGMFTIFVVVYISIQIYIIVSELDNYYHSIWFKEKVPREWFEVNIEEHFKKKRKSSQ